MTKTWAFTIVIVSVQLISFVVVSGQQTANQELEFSSLSLSISTTRSSFLLNEPIPITLELSNRTGKPILGHGTLRFSSNFVQIYLRTPDGTERQVKPLSPNRIFSVGKDSLIPPGTHVKHTELLGLDLDKHFPLAGNYQIKAVLKSRDGRQFISTDWTTLEISEPEGENLRALEYLRKKTDISRVFSAPETHDSYVVYEDFVNSFPNSQYTLFICRNLAEYYRFKGSGEKASLYSSCLESFTWFPELGSSTTLRN